MARTRLTVTGTPAGDVDVVVVSPPHTRRTDPMPLLVANDGPEYSRRAHLTRVLREEHTAGRIPALRLALLEPGPRNARYAANPDYADAVAQHVLPAVTRHARTAGRPFLMGTSLGALTSLQTEWRHPGTFGGLFLQSGSFFRRRLDGEESFEYWDRVTDFVASVHRARRRRTDARIVMTCGVTEQNLENNRQLAQALGRQGHDVTLAEVPGGHDWRWWQGAFDPHLLTLLQGSDDRQPNDREKAHG